MVHDLIIIGGGAAGEAAAQAVARKNKTAALVEKDLLGGECSFWACLPSKVLLDAAHRRSVGAELTWEHASRRRDWMIAREEIEYPDDRMHVQRLPDEVELVRGTAHITGPGTVEVDGKDGRRLQGRALLIAVGAAPVIPPIEGLDETPFWTSRDATSARELPSSIVILGGGPVGVELAQVFARFGVQTTIIESNERLLSHDHPKSSELLAKVLEEDGVKVMTSVRAVKTSRSSKGRLVELSDGSRVEAAELLVAVGRRPLDLRELGAEEAGVSFDGEKPAGPDDHLALAENVYVAGDVAGGMQFTHLADYEGRIAAGNALGGDERADLSVIPRTTFTDPETAAVGWTLEEAREKGHDAFEVSTDFAETSRGMTIEGAQGHLTAVVDSQSGLILGAFSATPSAAEHIHMPALAMKARVPVKVFADMITAYPTAARAMASMLGEAASRVKA